MSHDSPQYKGLATAWPRFQRLPLWARVLCWTVGWPVLVPLLLLAGPPATWRRVAAVSSFAVLGFFWAAMCAGAISGEPEPEPAVVQASTAAPTATIEAAAATSTSEATPAASSTPSATSTASGVAAAAPASPSAPTASPAAAATATSTPAEPAWRVTRIVDGDTLEVSGPSGAAETVRVVGIDTPERGQCGFAEAADALARMALGQDVTLVAGARDDRDQYGRILRYVDVEGIDAGLELIRGGFAIARYDSRDGYGRHPREDVYVAADLASLPICGAPTATPAPATPTATVTPTGTVSPTATATPAGPASSVQVFPNCAALNQVYPGGVARVGVTGNTVSGQLRPFGVTPVFDDELYAANSARDGDGDGIACER